MDVNIEDYEEKFLVLGHLLTRVELFRACQSKLLLTGYFADYPQLEAFFEIAVDYWNDKSTLAPFSMMTTYYRDYFAKRGITPGPALFDKLSEWYELPTSSPLWAVDFVRGEIEEVLKQHAKGLLTRQLAGTEDIEEALENLHDARREMEGGVFTLPTDRNPFDNLEANMSMSRLYPWGVPYLDKPLGGGSAVGEMIGVLLPSGGGKTTMALQILAAHVVKREHCIYMSSEQNLGGDMTNRMLCVGANLSRDALKGGYSNLAPEDMEMLLKIEPDWKQYCHFYEWAHKKVQSLDALFDVVRDLHSKGIYPKSIIWDWWGRFRTSMIMSMGNLNETAIRRHSANWLHEMRTIAGGFGLKTLVLHQLAGGEAQKSASHKPSSHGAQEDKNFNNMFDYCFTGGQRDENDVLNFIADKARTSARTDMRLLLNGPMCRFEFASDPDTNSEGLLASDDEDADYDEETPNTHGLSLE